MKIIILFILIFQFSHVNADEIYNLIKIPNLEIYKLKNENNIRYLNAKGDFKIWANDIIDRIEYTISHTTNSNGSNAQPRTPNLKIYTLNNDNNESGSNTDSNGNINSNLLGSPVVLNFEGSGYYFAPMTFPASWNSLTARTDTFTANLDPGEYTMGLRTNWDTSSGAEGGSGFSGSIQVNALLLNSSGETTDFYNSGSIWFVTNIPWLNNKKCLVNCGDESLGQEGVFLITESGTYTIKVDLIYNANDATISATLNNYEIAITNMF